MFGLVVFGLLGTYLLLLVAAPVWAYRYAAKKGLPHKQRWLWAAGGFLLVYLPVFWDWIPTVVTHRYYCAKEAGFWVYKTLEQWKVENPGVMETLLYNKKLPHVQTPYGSGMVLNERFLYQIRYEGPYLINRWRNEAAIVDRKNGEVIAREIDFSTSHERRQSGWSGWKFWLDSERCGVEKHRDPGSFSRVTLQFEGTKQ